MEDVFVVRVITLQQPLETSRHLMLETVNTLGVLQGATICQREKIDVTRLCIVTLNTMKKTLQRKTAGRHNYNYEKPFVITIRSYILQSIVNGPCLSSGYLISLEQDLLRFDSIQRCFKT